MPTSHSNENWGLLFSPKAALRAIRGASMTTADLFKAKARALARSGHFYGLPPLEFELSFEEGFHEAREWLALASTKEELEGLCQESRANRKAA
jgi:hypothetical protein